MAKIAQHCSKEQSKKFSELGITAPSSHKYVLSMEIPVITKEQAFKTGYITAALSEAYTLIELAQPLAKSLDTDVKNGNHIEAVVDRWKTIIHDKYFFTMAYNPEFVADCLIHLLETKQLTAQEVNDGINKLYE